MWQLIEQRADPATPAERRRQGFRLLMAGSTVSTLGSKLTAVAYPMLALGLTGSPLTAGWVAFAAMFPSLAVYWPAGVLADRLDPRRMMLYSEIGRGLAIGTVACLLLIGRLGIPLLIAIAIVEESLEVVTTLAEQRYIRRLTEPASVKSALVSMEIRTHAVSMVGRPLGGFMFGLTPILPFLVDALSFVVSVAALVRVKGKEIVAARLSRQPWNFGRDFSAGISRLVRDEYLRATMILDCGMTLVSQALFIVFLAVAHSQHLRPLTIGTVLAASGAGGVLGSLTAARFHASIGLSLLQVQTLAWTVAFAILAVSGGRSTLIMALTITVLAYTGALGNIEFSTYLVRHVPEGILARVSSTENLISCGACAVGPALGGLLAGEFGIAHAVSWLFAGTLSLAVFSLCVPLLRYHECPAGSPPSTAPELPACQLAPGPPAVTT
jgi:MFS family permease